MQGRCLARPEKKMKLLTSGDHHNTLVWQSLFGVFALLSNSFPESFDFFQMIGSHSDIAGFLVHGKVDLLGIGGG